jgi:DnaK suppressor protein
MSAHVNPEEFRPRLQQLEQQLTARLNVEGDAGREIQADQAESAELAVADELRDQYFTRADADATTLGEVRAALRRLEDGLFGLCEVDGRPIERKRLEAVPWARYCLQHQSERD